MAADYDGLKKGGFMRQKQKNKFSLRLKVVGGNLTAKQVQKIAEVADKYGEGYIHLTSRQGVEIPFIDLKDIDSVKEALATGDVVNGVCGPRVRTVTACQGSAICPSGCIQTTDLAKKISERYFGRELPHKFKFGVTGCVNNCLKAEENDIGVKGGYLISYDADACTLCGVCLKACRSGAISTSENGDTLVLDESKCNYCGRCVKSCPMDAWQGTDAYIVSFGGTFGNKIANGRELLPPISDEDALFRVMDKGIEWFSENANPSERFRSALERLGWAGLEEKIGEH